VRQPMDGLGTPDLARVYESGLDYVWHSLRRLGIPERDLPDVTHDVFVAASRTLPDYDPARPLKPWLFGVAFRVASDHLRLFRNQRESPQAEVHLIDIAPSPEQSLLDEEAWRLVDDCLERLDLRLRAVLIMHDFSEHEVPEIATALQIPVKTVYSRLRKARLVFSKTAARLAAQREIR
jgi:RNA polymerase sigma-70 factor, ECF subfamily